MSVSGSAPAISSARSRRCAARAGPRRLTALTRTSLLVLDAHDLHALMEREPRIAERIHEVVRSRLGGELLTPRAIL